MKIFRVPSRLTLIISALALTCVINMQAARPAAAANHSHGLSYIPVETPGVPTLPFVMKGGVKEFHLVAEKITRQVGPGFVMNAWGYNGSTPGPTIEVVQGDRVRILVTNHLPEATTVHWHGILLPNGMDGVGGLTQGHIPVGETYAYEYTIRQQPGTYMYHPHSDETTQIALGMMGFFIIHPSRPETPRVDRDFAIFLHEWKVEPGSATPNPMVMTDFNLFTFNSLAFPAIPPLVVRTGQRVRIRFANISMDSHPIHIHGHRFWITGNDGGPIPRSAWLPETTVNVQPGSTQQFEFVADKPGDWPLHCHKSHHTMGPMGHETPNMIGVSLDGVEEKVSDQVPGYMAMGENGGRMMDMGGPENTMPMMTGTGQFGAIEMGGMFTVVKIRSGLTSYADPGDYKNPPGTVSWKVENPPAPLLIGESPASESAPEPTPKPKARKKTHDMPGMPGMSMDDMPGMKPPASPAPKPAPKPGGEK